MDDIARIRPTAVNSVRSVKRKDAEQRHPKKRHPNRQPQAQDTKRLVDEYA